MRRHFTVPLALLSFPLLVSCQPTAISGPQQVYVTQRGKAGTVFAPQAASENTVDTKYAGKDRAHPKTSIDPAPVEGEFNSLSQLFETLPADQDMQEQLDQLVEEQNDPRAKFSETRLPDEQRNVRVKAWVYAVKSESDKDFHVIIGSSATKSKAIFMNVEAAGLPKQDSADTPVLRRVRQELNDLLPQGLPGGSAYNKLTKPIAVEVQGSLFYDIDHQPGVVGPLDMQPKTAWEIHPITELQKGHD